VLYIKAGAANMAGAWFIHRPVRPVRVVNIVQARDGQTDRQAAISVTKALGSAR